MMFVRKEQKLVQINRKPRIRRLSEAMDTNVDTPLHTKGIVHKGNVLIVDDEIDIVKTLLAYLSKNGYMGIGYTAGKEALDGLKKYDFDLLVVDLVLPDMNGIDLLKAAFKMDPHLVGIIITGKGSVQSAVNAMKAGAFDYLLKPFQFRMLSVILERAMHMRQLKISEKKYRLLVDELTNKMKEFQTAGYMLATKENGFFFNGIDQ